MFKDFSFEKPITKEEYLVLSCYLYRQLDPICKLISRFYGIDRNYFLDFVRFRAYKEELKNKSVQTNDFFDFAKYRAYKKELKNKSVQPKDLK